MAATIGIDRRRLAVGGDSVGETARNHQGYLADLAARSLSVASGLAEVADVDPAVA